MKYTVGVVNNYGTGVHGTTHTLLGRLLEGTEDPFDWSGMASHVHEDCAAARLRTVHERSVAQHTPCTFHEGLGDMTQD